MNSYLKILFLGFCLNLIQYAGAQRTIEGAIVNTAGASLDGVIVTNLRSQKTVLSDSKGHFTINASSADTVSFSYVGYAVQSILVGTQTVWNIVLNEVSTDLNQVVVIGFGQQKKQSIVGAIARVDGDALVKAGGVTNLSAALTGLAPGVTAIQTSGQPGRDQAQILIRGKGTWGNTNPLILVDGIERDFNDIDPQEVESISILKDASATAIFGVKGANGVILVTTKRGKKGQVKITATSNFGIKKPTYKFQLLDHATAMELANEANANDGNWNYIYSEAYINNWRNNINPQYYPEIDWGKELLKKAGYSQQYNVNFSGGTDFVKYFTSLGYLNDGDIFKTYRSPEYDPAYKFVRYNYRSNLDFTVTPTTTLSVNLAGNIGIRQGPNTYQGRDSWDGFGTSTQFKQMYTIPNYVFPVKYPNGRWGNNPANQWDNLVLDMNEQGNGTEKTSQMFSDLLFKQALDFVTKGLSLQAKVSYNSTIAYRRTITKNIASYYYSSPTDQNPQRFPSNNPDFVEKPVSFGGEYLSNDVRSLYYELRTDYNRSFGEHTVGVTGVVFRRKDYNNADFTAYQESWAGRATYNFKNKYYLEFNAAYNGSEKFAPGKRFGYFPSYGAGWILSEEKFMNVLKPVLSFLKVRYTYGKVGSDIGAPRFTYVTSYSSGGSAQFGDSSLTYYGPMYFEGGAANQNATWETAIKQDFAIEGKLFNKLSFTLDLYKENRKGILMTRNTIPIWFGTGNPAANIGETKNHGYELEVAWNDHIGTFNYGIRANYTFNENRVIFRDDPANLADYQKQAGKPIGWNSMLLNNGMFSSWNDIYNNTASSWTSGLIPGDFKYVDYNGDGVIDAQDFVPNGRLNYPAHTYGTTLTAGYKGVSLSAMFYGVSGVDLQIPYELLWEFPGNNSMAWPYSVDRWTPATATTADRPALHMPTNRKNNEQTSTFTYSNASYWRLKTLELSYMFAPHFLDKVLRISSWQVYVSGNNLFTKTGFDSRIDPESANTGVYPLIKRYNVGMRVSL